MNEDMRLFDLLPRYFANNPRIRNQRTKDHYYRAVRMFSAVLGRDAMLSDFCDENIHRWIRHTIDEEKLTEATANQRTKQIRAYWEWAARKRLVNEFPGKYRVPQPEQQPKGYSKDELQRLFKACAEQTGWIGPHRAATWWLCIHWILLDTAERVGAVLAIRREWIDMKQATIEIPAKHRKGGLKAATYLLSKRTMDLVCEMRRPPTETGLLFDRPWKDDQTTYGRYKKVVKAAGLPWVTRRSGFHKMRITVATMLEANGDDATKFLMHSSRRTTEESYIDAAAVLSQRKERVSVRFNPEEKQGFLSRILGKRPRFSP